MPITPEDFVAHYPSLYHMAEAGTWPSIEKHGLLSTSALLDLFGINGDQRRRIESEYRPDTVNIRHPQHGTAVIRDQKPMRESALRSCLRDMTPNQWYELLNGYAFFWVTGERVQTLLNARAYRDREHIVITVDTAALVAKYSERILLSPINSGSTIYNPSERGSETFRPFTKYPFAERCRQRGLSNAVAEAAVVYAVPDLRDFTLRVELRKANRTQRVVYSRA